MKNSTISIENDVERWEVEAVNDRTIAISHIHKDAAGNENDDVIFPLNKARIIVQAIEQIIKELEQNESKWH